jgi:DNA-binding GntR family transcriptional regulator
MQTKIFHEIQPLSVEEEVANQLREAIIQGQLELGQRLPEREIASQMNVSRIPVREAFRKLEQEGLITRQQNRGCFVITFSEKDIEEVFSLRAVLENTAIERAARHLTKEDYFALHDIIKRQQLAVVAKDYHTLTQLDIEFHEYFCIKADHSRLLKTWYEQQTQCRLLLTLRLKTLPDSMSNTVPQDHTKILELIEKGDLLAAKLLTLEISARTSQECIETLQGNMGLITENL